MKIVHVSTTLAVGGGAEAVLYRLVTGDEHNEHIIVSLQGKDGYGKMLSESGYVVEGLGMQRGRVSVSAVFRLWKLLRREKPAVLQTWMYHGDLVGGVAGYLARVPRIVWGLHHTNLDTHGTSRSTRAVARMCALLSHVVPDRIISCSTAGVQAHRDIGYSKSRLVVCNNGYDLSEFVPLPEARSQLNSELGIADTTFLMGMAARWNPQKDHPNLLDALVELQAKGQTDWHCLLMGVGMGKDNQELVAEIESRDLGDSVSLLNIRSDMPRVMAALDLHVLSSRFGEAFPNVLNEAMSCGTPCVTTDVGDSALIVGETGWVVPISQPDLFASAVAEAIGMRHAQGWQKRRESCRQRVLENFSVEKMVENYSAVWRG